MLRMRAGYCPECEEPACLCHNAEHHRAKAEAERQRAEAELQRRAEAEHVRWIETAPPSLDVLLQRAALPAEGGLIISGVATTRAWDKTPTRQHGRLPRKMCRNLPVPLLWRHDAAQVLGTMYEATATADVLRFRACVVPPETPGYDATLLRRVWDDIRSGAAGEVSFAAQNIRPDGSWTPVELSVAPKGAHPCAVITRAEFPDGHVVERDEVPFDEATVIRASHAHRAKGAHRSRSAKVQTQSIQGDAALTALVEEMVERRLDARFRDLRAQTLADCYRGAHSDGTTYRRGDAVTCGGSLWLALEDTTARPGSSGAFKLIVKAGRDARK